MITVIVAAPSLRHDLSRQSVIPKADVNGTRLLAQAAGRQTLVQAVTTSLRVRVRAETRIVALADDMDLRTRTRVMAANRLVSIVARLPRLVSLRLVRRESVRRQELEIARRR